MGINLTFEGYFAQIILTSFVLIVNKRCFHKIKQFKESTDTLVEVNL